MRVDSLRSTNVFIPNQLHCAIICPRAFPDTGISGLVVEYIVAIDVTRVRFPADAYDLCVEKAARRKAV